MEYLYCINITVMKKIHLISALVARLGTTQWCAAQSKATFYTNNGNFVVDLYDTMQPITT